LLIHIERRQGKRLVTHVAAVRNYDSAADRYDLEYVYDRER
jgi:hypothetical protein